MKTLVSLADWYLTLGIDEIQVAMLQDS